MSLVKRHPIITFFVLSYVITWGFLPFELFGAFGPLVAALIVIPISQGVAGLKELGLRRRWRGRGITARPSAPQNPRRLRAVEAAPRTLERPPHNLPLRLSSFVGREKELTKVNRLLENIRLLTFTGSGGCAPTHYREQAKGESRSPGPTPRPSFRRCFGS